MPRILVVDDEPADLHLIAHCLEKQGHELVTAGTARDALQLIKKTRPQAIVLDIMLPDGNGLDVLKKIQEVDDRIPVVFVTSSADSDIAIRAMKMGALDHLVKPIDIVELRTIVERAVQIRHLTDRPVEVNADVGSVDMHAIIGKCGQMQEVYKSIGIVAGQDVTVLIRGESGTGKELVARALYQYSDRVKGPFLAVNCAAIPDALLESELFGHERGSFTGADRKRIGKFEQSSGGTLFLDEIGDMSPVLQAKVLRVLQEKTFERVGGNEVVSADVRVIAATNRDLETMVAHGEFRSDLYYRLNGFTIHLPPLRERGSDLEMLVNHFRRIANRELDKNVREVAPAALERIRQYHWPGNIRELQNVIKQSILKTNGPVLLDDFVPELGGEYAIPPSDSGPSSRHSGEQPGREPKGGLTLQHNGDLDTWIEEKLANTTENVYRDVVGDVQQRLLRLALRRAAGDQDKAASLLGVDPRLLEHAETPGLHAVHPTSGDDDTIVFRPGMTLAEIEKEAIRVALKQTDGCRKAAAELLGMSTRTMQRRVKQYDLD